MKITRYLDHSPVFNLLRVGRGLSGVVNQAWDREGVNFGEALLMISILFEDQGAVRPSRLAEVFEMSRSNISHALSRLQKRKLIQRAMIEEDARAYQIELTPKGRALAISLIRYFDGIQARIEKDMTESGVLKFIAQTRKVVALIGQDQASARPRARRRKAE